MASVGAGSATAVCACGRAFHIETTSGGESAPDALRLVVIDHGWRHVEGGGVSRWECPTCVAKEGAE